MTRHNACIKPGAHHTLGPLIPPRQPTQHLRSKRLHTRPHRLHLLRSHTMTRPGVSGDFTL